MRIVELDLKIVDLVYVDGWSYQKKFYFTMSYKNQLKLQNFSTASWLKIQVDSLFIEQPVLS